jgi:glyoxylase-like metal-dependent hydrolase (beta-lactamase superfamily II)
MEHTEAVRESSQVFTVAPGVWGRRDVFVNYYFIYDETSERWALIDTGLHWSADDIVSIAQDLFGEGVLPAAIILTHGHFDHVGSVQRLSGLWHVPVYVQEQEMPYVTGKAAYPPPDPEVGGGMMSLMSTFYPSDPIDLRGYVKALPYDGTIPGFPEWKYLHTPGHSPGHISLFRESDRILIAGDAITTTKSESATSTLLQTQVLSGPPKYFTCNWASAKLSVMKLDALKPEVVASGHGRPMSGVDMRKALDALATHFDEVALPHIGRYVDEPAVTNDFGVAYIPAKPKRFPVVTVALSAAVMALCAFVVYRYNRD